MESIKVMMIGGYSCGKTSGLSCMFEQATNSPISQYLTISDRTLIECDIDRGVETILNKKLELRQFLSKSPSSPFSIAPTGGHCFNRYTFMIRDFCSSKSVSLEILDVPGSILGFSNNTEINEQINEEVNRCDVIIVCIDTPYLMGPIEDQSKELCSEDVNLIVNKVHEIHNHLLYLDDEAKLVLFVPLKCEKWSKEGRLGEVNNRIKKVYHNTIQALLSHEKINVGIIPIETVGNIIFSEFTEPLLIQKGKFFSPKHCSKISGSIVRLDSGRLYNIKDSDYIYPDESFYLLGTNIRRPYSWFYVCKEDSSYSPKNGDQLLLHILNFFVKIKKRKRSSFMHYLLPPDFLYPEELKWLENIISQLKANNLIINNKDGIDFLKKSY